MASNAYDRILERYGKGFVTDAQLDRYVELGVITAAEAKKIRTVTSK